MLLQSVQDFMDVNDLATLNTVYSELSQVYSKINMINAGFNENSIDQMDELLDSKSLISNKEARDILKHFLSALKTNFSENHHFSRDIN